MKLNDLLKGSGVSAPSELELTRLVIDSREILEGDIFCALQGENQDGHFYAKKALDKGAAAVIIAENRVSQLPKLPIEKSIVCPNPLKLLQHIAASYAANFDLKMIGITGSSGKTSTRQLIAHILQQEFSVVQSIKNFNNHIGFPLSLLEWRRHHQFAVMELGANHVGEIKALCDLKAPDMGLITTIAPAHIEGFASIEGVQKAKYELLDAVPQDGTLFLNVNDDRISAYPVKSREVIRYGLDTEAEFSVRIIGYDEMARPKIEWAGVGITLQTPGPHTAINAAAAIAVAMKCGCSKSSIIHGLESFLPDASRGLLQRINGITLMNDSYNANPQSMAAAIHTLAKMACSGKKYLILGDMLELGSLESDAHKTVGRLAVELGFDYLFAFGERMEEAVKQARKMGMVNAIHFVSKDLLVSTLKSITAENDILLIKGSRGMAMESIIYALGGKH